MKKSIFGILSASLLLIGVATMQSCSDNCKDVTCQNGGTCNDGVCDCPTGFFGDNCQTECMNGGTGSNTGCACATGYSGTKCEIEDKCVTMNVKCNNGGTCDSGICSCPVGYEGTSCDSLSRNKFLGDFSAIDDCTTPPNTPYNVTVSTSSTGMDKFLIKGFGIFDCAGTYPDILASANKTTLVIADQTFCSGQIKYTKLSGSISSDGNTITLNYTVQKETSTSKTCKSELKRK